MLKLDEPRRVASDDAAQAAQRLGAVPVRVLQQLQERERHFASVCGLHLVNLAAASAFLEHVTAQSEREGRTVWVGRLGDVHVYLVTHNSLRGTTKPTKEANHGNKTQDTP